MGIKAFLAAKLRENPANLCDFEPAAISAMSGLQQDMSSHVRDLFSRQPSLHLLEYLVRQPDIKPLDIRDHQAADSLARQIPHYAKQARTPQQEVTTLLALDTLARYAERTQSGSLLPPAFTGLKGWSPRLQQQIVEHIPHKLAQVPSAHGLIHALRGSKPDSEDYSSCLFSLHQFQTDQRVRMLLRGRPDWQIAAATSPSPAGNLGDHLLRSALVCVISANISPSEKQYCLQQTLQETSRFRSVKSDLPDAIHRNIANSDHRNLSHYINKTGDKLSKLGSLASKLFTPKTTQKTKRHQLIVRDKVGQILARQDSIQVTQTKAPKVQTSVPPPLVQPKVQQPGPFNFHTHNLILGDLAVGLTGTKDLHQDTPPAIKPGQVTGDSPPAPPKKSLPPERAKKTILPSSKAKDQTRALNHETSIEEHSEEFDTPLI